MRAMLFVVLCACGPKVQTSGGALDEDLGHRTAAPAATDDAPTAARPVAAPGKGLRTGTIARAHLLAVLDQGPGAFLRQLEVAPKLDGSRFVGWQLVQLVDRGSPLADVDVQPGDVLLAINDKPLSRPDELQALWDSLRTAPAIRATLWRGSAKLELAFQVL